MTDRSDTAWNQDEIAGHLRSAVDSLTPNVFDKIDLSTPQDFYLETPKRVRLYRRLRPLAVAAAACLCISVLGGGMAVYQNRRVESIIGIDVNPSVELSVNRNEKGLRAEALNEDAEAILDDMELKNVDLDVAVNALIGSMVKNGYLDELDNAILVTVSNEDSEKASVLRQDVVGDIETSLEEHEVEAVVYDQQATVTKEVKEIADRYGISYGKAYFLQELVAENNLSEADLKMFAGMTMEEIAAEIAERSYRVGSSEKETSSEADTSSALSGSSEAVVQPSESESVSESMGTASSEPISSEAGNQTEHQGSAAASTAASTEESQEQNGSKAKIDYVDYENGMITVVFKSKVKWKNPTVAVYDESGQSYAAMISDTDAGSCEIEVSGLPGNQSCTFSLAGVALRDGGSFGTVKGYFETPDIAEGLEPEEPEEETPAPEVPKETESVPAIPETPAESLPSGGEISTVDPTEISRSEEEGLTETEKTASN